MILPFLGSQIELNYTFKKLNYKGKYGIYPRLSFPVHSRDHRVIINHFSLLYENSLKRFL